MILSESFIFPFGPFPLRLGQFNKPLYHFLLIPPEQWSPYMWTLLRRILPNYWSHCDWLPAYTIIRRRSMKCLCSRIPDIFAKDVEVVLPIRDCGKSHLILARLLLKLLPDAVKSIVLYASVGDSLKSPSNTYQRDWDGSKLWRSRHVLRRKISVLTINDKDTKFLYFPLRWDLDDLTSLQKVYPFNGNSITFSQAFESNDTRSTPYRFPYGRDYQLIPQILERRPFASLTSSVIISTFSCIMMFGLWSFCSTRRYVFWQLHYVLHYVIVKIMQLAMFWSLIQLKYGNNDFKYARFTKVCLLISAEIEFKQTCIIFQRSSQWHLDFRICYQNCSASHQQQSTYYLWYSCAHDVQRLHPRFSL